MNATQRAFEGALDRHFEAALADSPALWLVDGVQGLGKLDLRLAERRIDYAPFSGHKLYAPKGIGMLYVREGAPFTPLLAGGGQESASRSGTENTAGIAALGVSGRHHRGIHGAGRRARHRLDRQVGLFQQAIEDAPCECAMGAAALQSKVDQDGRAAGPRRWVGLLSLHRVFLIGCRFNEPD